jgi:hypothetical protein
MNILRMSIAVPVMTAALAGAAHLAWASQDYPRPPPFKPNLSGLHDFDLRAGEWVAHHRRLQERLAGSHEWVEFDGTQSFRLLMDGYANEDENVLNMPDGGAYKGVTLRAYDSKSGQWAIWWLDGRTPFGDLDPPVKGRFVNGVGTFYSDDTLRGKPVRVRFVWSNITADSAHWEQAFSPDGGKTWEVNWITDFKRAR